MKRKIGILSMMYILHFVAVYLFAAFDNGGFDIEKWTQVTKDIIVFFESIVLLVIGVITCAFLLDEWMTK